MDNFLLIGGIALGVAGLLSMFISYAVYGGTRTALTTAKVGEVFNFTYEQPLRGEPERVLAKVIEPVYRLNDVDIRRLNARSNYRRNDPNFKRTQHLVTCQMPNGSVRQFYAERTKNCRRPIMAGLLFSTAAASLL